MPVCCVSACKNRYSSTCEFKFYRIPSAHWPFQANRRRLWLQAIQQVNGSTEELHGNARICGAHFISGEASMDHDNPDFVPSVFNATCSERSPSIKKKPKWFYGRRKRRRRCGTASAGKDKKTTPSSAESPVGLISPAEEEEPQTPSSPSVPQEGETLTTEVETESGTKTIISEATPSPDKELRSIKMPADLLELVQRIPIVVLKRVYVAGNYRCEFCSQNFTTTSQLFEHKRLHEEKVSVRSDSSEKLSTSFSPNPPKQPCVAELSFQCNMCDRSFPSSHHLKRHKLLHVKDARKCKKCGVLFCRRHNHIVYQPQTESEHDSYLIVPENVGSNLVQENDLVGQPEPEKSADLDDDDQNTMTTTPLLTTTPQTVLPVSVKRELSSTIHNALPPASHMKVLTEIPFPVLKKPSSVPRPSSPPSSRNDYPSTFAQSYIPHHQELPPSLKMFSPQYLTSAFLEVNRNYQYILSKPVKAKKTKIVKEEPLEQPLMAPINRQSSVVRIKSENSAYDLEIML